MNTLNLTLVPNFKNAIGFTQENKVWSTVKEHTPTSGISATTTIGVTVETGLPVIDITTDEFCALLQGLHPAWMLLAKEAYFTKPIRTMEMCRDSVLEAEITRRAIPHCTPGQPMEHERLPISMKYNGDAFFYDPKEEYWFGRNITAIVRDGAVPTFDALNGSNDKSIMMTAQGICNCVANWLDCFARLDDDYTRGVFNYQLLN